MFYAVLMARVILGGMFLVFGLNHFLKFIPMPDKTLPDAATEFGKILFTTGYLDVVKVLEVVGGLLVLSGRFVPLGLVLLTPVAVNILLFEVYLVGEGGPGVALVTLCVLLIWAYRSHFAALFTMKPKIG